MKKYYHENQLKLWLQDAKICNMNANSDADIMQYYITNIKAMNADEQFDGAFVNGLFILHSVDFLTEYAVATIINSGVEYRSYYVRSNYRSQGIFTSLMKESVVNNEIILTTKRCDLEATLQKLNVRFRIAETYLAHTEHSMLTAIEAAYGDKRAERTKVPYMYHIYEGVQVLMQLLETATEDEQTDIISDAATAYIIHPLAQVNGPENRKILVDMTRNSGVDPIDIVNAFSYSTVANSFLSTHWSEGVMIDLDTKAEPVVAAMLIADKVQNRKDFEYYYAGSHQNNATLKNYFEYWLAHLGISEETYQEMKQKLIAPTSSIHLSESFFKDKVDHDA